MKRRDRRRDPHQRNRHGAGPGSGSVARHGTRSGSGLGQRVTVVVPTRDELENIGSFVASVPLGVPIVAVDASRDETPARLRALRPRDCRVIEHPGGIAIARDIGARAARTQWIVFTDVDVSFAPGYFDALARRIGDGSVDAVYGPKLSLDEHRRLYSRFSRGQALLDGLGIPAVSGSNFAVRRDTYLAVGGFDLGLTCNEDSELGWRLARAGRRIAFAPEIVVHARDHRRVEAGRWRKTLHTALRCTLLYTHTMPAAWRSSDWGYWSRTRP